MCVCVGWMLCCVGVIVVVIVEECYVSLSSGGLCCLKVVLILHFHESLILSHHT